MIPQNPLRDIMLRTMENLQFIEQHATEQGPYEVTQLVNSFLAALAHPWERYSEQLNSMTLEQVVTNGWPKLDKTLETDIEPKNFGVLLRLVRNSFAHGNIEFCSNDGNEITHIKIWNENNGKRTWGTIASVKDMRLFLERFVKLAEGLTEIDLKNASERKKIL